jgi:hypothetical protein
MKKYQVISEEYTDWIYDIELKFIRYLKGTEYPYGVTVYYYNKLESAERRVTKEFLKGKSAYIVDTEESYQEYLELLNNYAEAY